MSKLANNLSAFAFIAILASTSAMAELPRHPTAQNFGPTAEDMDWPEGQPPPSTEFGYAVAIRDGFAFVGNPYGYETGRVAVYKHTVDGWARHATLSSTSSADTRFGSSMYSRDGLVIIGAQLSAHVFKRSNGAWTHSQRLTVPASDEVVAFPVALRHQDGTLFATGYRGEDQPSYVYRFTRNSSGKFILRGKLSAPTYTRLDNFGYDLSMTHNSLVVGAPRGYRGFIFGVPSLGAGTVYLYKRNGAGEWVLAQELTPNEPAAAFGTAVAIDRNMIIVGASREDVEGGVDGETPDGHIAGGAAYGFVPVNGLYIESFRLRPRPDEDFGFLDFGFDIEMFDNHIAIAAAAPYGAISYLSQGKVFTYRREGSTLTLRGVAGGHIVGPSISLANKWLLVGAPWEARCYYGCIGEARFYDVSRYEQP
jgi:hypothetical protein